MKTLITIILALFHLSASAQTNTAKFKIIEYDENGKIEAVEVQTLNVDGVLDIDFYMENFSEPRFSLPDTLVNTKYKNETIQIWNDTTRPMNTWTNWVYTYKYDHMSRVSSFSYSNCMACSRTPYTMHIRYDSKNRPVVLSIDEYDKKYPEGNKYLIKYDSNNAVIQLKCYTEGKLRTKIDKI